MDAPTEKTGDETPQLRHEFVGMMFAITIGEVGLQVAALVQAGRVIHFLPAYGHLLLATIVVATSWVGWSVSMAPGARQDVHRVFQLEFLILLIDVVLVITYFILVRTIDFGKEGSPPRIDPPSKVAQWVFLIFILYFLWDIITKVFIYAKEPAGDWIRDYGSRMIPAIICLIASWIVWRQVEGADRPHWLSADLALLSLVLLFRALKELISACFPRDARRSENILNRIKVPVRWTLLLIFGVTIGTLATKFSWPFLPDWIVKEISMPVSEVKEH